ncbi:hypothetical protein CLOM_g16643 [Closterium sp. NIES-68]|nr:hypothetical protein CLOM_g16643 [Closterium sp. NIES-68]
MHPSLPLVASCGLDRYLRIHHLHTRRLMAKVFLKQPMSMLRFLPEGVSTGTAASGSAGSKRKLADVTTMGGDTAQAVQEPAEASRPPGNGRSQHMPGKGGVDKEGSAGSNAAGRGSGVEEEAGSSVAGRGSGRAGSRAGKKGASGPSGSKRFKQAA